MSTATENITFECPPQVRERLPASGTERSQFILQAIQEKLERAQPVEWKPTTNRGRIIAELLEKGKAERYPLLNEEEFERELQERRGRNF